MKQRIRCGGIVFIENKMVSMYREFNNRIYYTFPGGGLEENETEEQCVVREIEEEFGITVQPVKKLYTYNGKKGKEHFFLCEYISGSFGTGNGEEFQGTNIRGVYKPVLIEVKDIPNLPLLPPEVAKQFFEDFMQNGKTIRKNVLHIKNSF